ncbi:hypothetical protein EVAR_80838_1 [Eumeta japonica]|uniref:Dirigent protein n=1 Tax=Eumeta variegata TaxID=151549 RepID=A0A4C1V1C9_EUMVA|nr:hypothetical protein EVAR_80838_1 [Eumeta japonica]
MTPPKKLVVIVLNTVVVLSQPHGRLVSGGYRPHAARGPRPLPRPAAVALSSADSIFTTVFYFSNPKAVFNDSNKALAVVRSDRMFVTRTPANVTATLGAVGDIGKSRPRDSREGGVRKASLGVGKT